MGNAPAVVATVLAAIGGYAAYRWMQRGFIEEIGDSDVRLEASEPVQAADPAEAGGAGEAAPNAAGDVGDAAGNAGDVGRAFDEDDRARRALEERQQQQMANMAAGEHGEPRVAAWKQKGTVGTKKAKSLARREQRRAYFEYVRSQADHERERIRLEEEMFGDLIAEEREEREARVAEAREALDEANAARRAEEEAERQRAAERRAQLLRALAPENGGVVALQSDEDIDICENMSDVLVLESGDFAVRVTPQSVQAVAAKLKHGKLDLPDLARVLAKSY